MIQAISPSNIQTPRSVTPLREQSFGHTPGMYDAPPYQRKKKSPVAWTAEQFIKGAAVSVVIDGLMNGFNKVSKNPRAMMPFAEIAKHAGFWGVAWIAMGLVFGGFDKMNNRH